MLLDLMSGAKNTIESLGFGVKNEIFRIYYPLFSALALLFYFISILLISFISWGDLLLLTVVLGPILFFFAVLRQRGNTIGYALKIAGCALIIGYYLLYMAGSGV